MRKSLLSPNQRTELRGVVTGKDVRGVDPVNFPRSVGTRAPARRSSTIFPKRL